MSARAGATLAVLLLLGACGGDASSPSDGSTSTDRDAAVVADARAPTDGTVPGVDSRRPSIGDAPAWFVDAPEGEWIEVAAGADRSDLAPEQRGERIVDVAPDPLPPGAEGVSAVTNDWTGGAALQARGEYLLPAQGGHNGYYGNEIYALALREETPRWARIWGPTPNDQISTSEHPRNAPYTAYADGSPRPWHGWFHVQTSESDERIWLLGTGANPSGTWTTETYSIARGDLAAGWTYHGRLWTDLGGASDFFYQGGPSGYDRTTHTLWQAAEASNIEPFLVRVDVATAVAAGAQPETGPLVPGLTGHLGYHAAELAAPWGAIAHDLTPRVWILAEPDEEDVVVLDLDDPDAGFTTVVPTGTPPPGYGADMGAVYHAPSRSLIVAGLPGSYSPQSDRRLWKLSIPSDPRSDAYRWTEITPAGGATPEANDQFRGTFGKLQMIEDMGNGQSAIVFVTNVEGPTYVYKVPIDGI